MNRLLCAAIVSRSFAAKLLSEPARALEEGYLGEQFALTPGEQATVMSIRVTSVQEFAAAVVAQSLLRPDAAGQRNNAAYDSSQPDPLGSTYGENAEFFR